jgi:hypothetical protein
MINKQEKTVALLACQAVWDQLAQISLPHLRAMCDTSQPYYDRLTVPQKYMLQALYSARMQLEYNWLPAMQEQNNDDK